MVTLVQCIDFVSLYFTIFLLQVSSFDGKLKEKYLNKLFFSKKLMVLISSINVGEYAR